MVEYFNEITNPTWMKYVIFDNNGNVAIRLYQNQKTTYTFQIKTKSRKNDRVNMYDYIYNQLETWNQFKFDYKTFCHLNPHVATFVFVINATPI